MVNSNGPDGTVVKSNAPALPDSNSAENAPDVKTIFAPSRTAPSLSMIVPLMLPVPPGADAFGSCSLLSVEDADGVGCDCADNDPPKLPSSTPTAVRHCTAKRRMRDDSTSTRSWFFLIRQSSLLVAPLRTSTCGSLANAFSSAREQKSPWGAPRALVPNGITPRWCVLLIYCRVRLDAPSRPKVRMI